MTELFKNKYRVNTVRLPGWNYSWPGYYFVTICTKNRVCYFGEIADEEMILNQLGQIVLNEWEKTEKIRSNIKLHDFVIMPNHIHGIIQIIENVVPDKYQINTQHIVDTHGHAYLPAREQRFCSNKFGPQINNLASIIRGFKGAVKNWCSQNGNLDFFWQPGYYEHIIRDEESLKRISKYIIDNPKKWQRDRNNPIIIKNVRF